MTPMRPPLVPNLLKLFQLFPILRLARSRTPHSLWSHGKRYKEDLWHITVRAEPLSPIQRVGLATRSQPLWDSDFDMYELCGLMSCLQVMNLKIRHLVMKNIILAGRENELPYDESLLHSRVDVLYRIDNRAGNAVWPEVRLNRRSEHL